MCVCVVYAHWCLCVTGVQAVGVITPVWAGLVQRSVSAHGEWT